MLLGGGTVKTWRLCAFVVGKGDVDAMGHYCHATCTRCGARHTVYVPTRWLGLESLAEMLEVAGGLARDCQVRSFGGVGRR